MNPKVSVCIVTYNQEKFIRQCLQSMVDQHTNFDFEVIVSDDCSTDKTREIITEFQLLYPKIIKPVMLDKNIGVFKNFIRTHNLATGNFVCHCDGDDYFLQGKLQSQYDYLIAHDDCSVVWHRMKIEEGLDTYFLGSPAPFLKNGVVDAGTLLRIGSIGAHSSIMYRRAARKTFDEGRALIDFYYSLEYIRCGYGYYMDEVLGVYRKDQTGASMTSLRKGVVLTKKYLAQHSLEFFRNNKAFRRDVFIGAVINFFYDALYFRSSAWNFLNLALKSVSVISVNDIVTALRFKSCLSKKSSHEK